MKEFLKYVLATIVGLFATGLVLFIIGAIFLVSLVASSNSSSETTVKDNSVFYFDLNGSVSERQTGNPLGSLIHGSVDEYGLDDILSAIQKAKENDKIKGIYINAESFSCGSASLQAIRKALLDFKKSNKFIVAYAGTYTQGTYYLASVADKLIVNPSGTIEWHGLSAQTMFYKGLMDKLGVEMQIFRVGTYKSAVEPYTETQMSEANKEQTQAFIGSIWNQMLGDISASRHISVEKLNELADVNMDFCQADEYIKVGLADTLMYKDQVESYLKNLTSCKEKDDLKTLGLDDMINVKEQKKNDSKNVIAVYYACGEIDGNMSAGDGIDSEQMAQDLSDLRKDDDVKAVVLRVNSPGGSAYGSEQIWREVALLKAKKPVVVSMGDYAASGGYYISCAAHKIVAEPNTLTGSIGIFGMVPNTKGLVQDKLGLKIDGVKTNRLSDMGDIYRPFSEEEKVLVQNMVNKGYELFTKRCAEGRKMPVDSIKKIAEGRVWTGTMAKDIHLVDELGGLDKALEIAGKLAKVKDYKVESYPEEEGLLSSLLNSRLDRYIQSKAQSAFGDYYNGFSFFKNLDKADRLQARMPFFLTIN